MNIIRFLRDYRIDYKEERSGWVQVCCTFPGCNDTGYHLGIRIDGDGGHCWKCRGKSMLAIIRELVKCSWQEAGRILNQYSDERPKKREEQTRSSKRNAAILPAEMADLTERHRQYLIKRNFDPDLMERCFDLKGTKHLGDLAFRIIAPIYYQHRIVSWQGRDITGKSEAKYITCAPEHEAVFHKHIVYGYDRCSQDGCVVVEGITGVWRLGAGAVATFGTGFKIEQIQCIKKRFKRVFLLFDPEDHAQQTAEEMAYMFGNIGVECHIIEPDDCDPGDMKQDEANYLMKELNLHGWNKENI